MKVFRALLTETGEAKVLIIFLRKSKSPSIGFQSGILNTGNSGLVKPSLASKKESRDTLVIREMYLLSLSNTACVKI